MDFSHTDEQIDLIHSVRKFAQAMLVGNLATGDFNKTTSGYNWRVDWQKCADEGLLGLCIPVEYGGQGYDIQTSVFMLEALGYGCRDNGFTLGINGQVWAVQEPIFSFGTDAQKQKYLPDLCNGTLIGSDAMTEPTTGSDISALLTTAIPHHDGYLLNGEKTMIGLAPECDVAMIFAMTNPDYGQWGISVFLVDADTPGFNRGPALEKMGLRSVPLGSIILKDCWIPKDSLLGVEGAGMSIFHHCMEWERSFIFSSHVGSMQRQLEDCIIYANEREAFKKPIVSFQTVSDRLANMKLRLELSQLLLYKAAWLKDQGQSSAMEAAMTKLHISESFVESSMDAMRIYGGKGYLVDYGIERDLRDAAGGIIYGGTSDIQRQLIASMLKDM